MRTKWLAPALATAGCSIDLPAAGPGATTSDQAAKYDFFDQAAYERQSAGPWEQVLDPELVDTAKFAGQDFVKQDMPPPHHATCGGESMPGCPGPRNQP